MEEHRNEITIEQVFEKYANGEGIRSTLGVNFPPSVAKAIRRTGNRKDSISSQILAMIYPTKLQQLLEDDAAHQRRCDAGH